MNFKLLNITLCFVLVGCGSFSSTNEEGVNKNAPIFVRPNTNAKDVNKPPTSLVQPQAVKYNAEKYLMIKENDFNLIVNKKVNEIILNKQPKVNESELNNEKVNDVELNKGPGDQATRLIALPPDNSPEIPVVLELTPIAENKQKILLINILIVLGLLSCFGIAGHFLLSNKNKR